MTTKPEEGGSQWLSAVTIPMVLLILPGVGGYLGMKADAHFGSKPWGVLIGIVVGLVLAGFQIGSILKKISGDPGKK